jgi:hypothetical protein
VAEEVAPAEILKSGTEGSICASFIDLKEHGLKNCRVLSLSLSLI